MDLSRKLDGALGLCEWRVTIDCHPRIQTGCRHPECPTRIAVGESMPYDEAMLMKNQWGEQGGRIEQEIKPLAPGQEMLWTGSDTDKAILGATLANWSTANAERRWREEEREEERKEQEKRKLPPSTPPQAP